MNNPILFCCECEQKVNPVNVAGVIICTNCQSKREEEYKILEEKCKSFEGSFNSATNSLANQMKIIDRLTQETFDYKKEIGFLKESRSKWAKQSSDNAEELERQIKRSSEGARKAEERERRFRVTLKEKNNIGYKCPTCRNSTVTLDAAGFLVCSLIGCKDPGRIHEIISRELVFEAGNQID